MPYTDSACQTEPITEITQTSTAKTKPQPAQSLGAELDAIEARLQKSLEAGLHILDRENARFNLAADRRLSAIEEHVLKFSRMEFSMNAKLTPVVSGVYGRGVQDTFQPVSIAPKQEAEHMARRGRSRSSSRSLTHQPFDQTNSLNETADKHISGPATDSKVSRDKHERSGSRKSRSRHQSATGRDIFQRQRHFQFDDEDYSGVHALRGFYSNIHGEGQFAFPSGDFPSEERYEVDWPKPGK